MKWIYFPARGWGDFRPGRGRRADERPAGGPIREPAGGRESRLLVLEWSAVHVAGLTIRLAAEAQDGGVILEGPDVELSKGRLGLSSGSPYVLGCHRLVRCLGALGEFERALRYADYAVQAAETADDAPSQAWAYIGRAFPMIAKGEFAQALPWLERAVQLCETKRVLLCLPTAYVISGLALAWLHRPIEGLSYLERGVTTLERMGAKLDLSLAYLAWAEGLLLAGNIQDAKRTADRALELAVASGERGNEVGILRLLAEISASEAPSALGPAVSFYERAKALAAELAMRPLVAHCHLGLAKLSQRTGERDEAQKHLTTAKTMYRDMNMRFWLARVESEMTALA